MNEYVITFKYDDEGYMRHIIAESEDDAVGIAFARTRGMLKNFDAKNVVELDVKEVGKKVRSPTITGRITGGWGIGDQVGAGHAPPVGGWDEGEGPTPTAAPTYVPVSAQEARRIHEEGGLWYTPDTFVLGYQFYYRGQIHIITSGGNEVAGDSPNRAMTDASAAVLQGHQSAAQLAQFVPTWARTTWGAQTGSPRAG